MTDSIEDIDQTRDLMNRAETWANVLGKGLFLPQGIIGEWSDDDWDLFSVGLERLSPMEQDLVWDVLQARDDNFDDEHENRETSGDTKEDDFDPKFGQDLDPPEDTDLDTGDAAIVPLKKESEMTDDEWADFVMGVEGESLADEAAKGEKTDSTEKGESEGARQYEVDPKENCTCRGPGSKEPKWTTHTTSCVCYDEKYDKPKPGQYSTTYKAKTCKHEHQEFELDEGLTIIASAHRDVKDEGPGIDFGLYFDSSWVRTSESPLWTTAGMVLPSGLEYEATHPMAYLSWPDMDAPDITAEDMLDVVDWVMESLGQGKVVEVGCIGGHGRTGTFLAVLLGQQGVDPLTAIKRVWSTYCIDAIESVKQTNYIVECFETVYGEAWRHADGVADAWTEMLQKNFVKSQTYAVAGYKPGGSQSSQSKGKDWFHFGWL